MTKATEKISAKDNERLTELRAKIIDEKGDYKIDASIDELTELAALEAKATGQRKPPEIKKEKEPEKVPKPVDKEKYISPAETNIKPKTNMPKIVKPWVKKGFLYYGEDSHGAHILWNKDEGKFYRLNRDPAFVDALCEKLQVKYLESLK